MEQMVDKLLYVSMTGAKQSMNALAIKANNIANANTTGFKADLAQARSMQAFGDGLPTRVFSMAENPTANFQSGAIQTTGRDLDIAIKDKAGLPYRALMGKRPIVVLARCILTKPVCY